MTSVEIPSSVAAALPTLAVFDITNDVSREVRKAVVPTGLAYITPVSPSSLIRVTERESGFFCDLEDMLSRIVPLEHETQVRAALEKLNRQIAEANLRIGWGPPSRRLPIPIEEWMATWQAAKDRTRASK